MANISILGAGGFGVALAVMISGEGHRVSLWSAFENEIQQLKNDGEHKKLLPNIPISKDIVLTTDLNIVKSADLVIIAVPSSVVGKVAESLVSIIPQKTVICNVAKGLEQDTLTTLSEVISKKLPNNDVVVLSGPSHAEEVAKKIPTTVVVSSKNMESAFFVQDLLMNDYFRIYTNSDTLGVELGGALKNIIALCAGVCDGMELGDNTKAALMTRGLAEIARLGVKMGAKKQTFAGLSGVGDLIVTCTSMHSRNRRAGILLGQGFNAEQVLEKIAMTVEGISATKAAFALSQKYDVQMPIVKSVYKVIFENQDIKQMVKNLMTRPKNSEQETTWLETT